MGRACWRWSALRIVVLVGARRRWSRMATALAGPLVVGRGRMVVVVLGSVQDGGVIRICNRFGLIRVVRPPDVAIAPDPVVVDSCSVALLDATRDGDSDVFGHGRRHLEVVL